MQNKNLSLCALLFLSGFFFMQSAYGQENFIPGTIITLKGDSLHGFIDYLYWGKNPVSISFKESETSTVIVYNPMTIKGFTVHKEQYTSAIVQAEGSPGQTPDLNFDPELKLRTDTAFLKALVVGTRNLYYYSDGMAKQQFYIQQGTEFDLLIFKRYLKKNGENREYKYGVIENYKFLGQLALFLQDCPNIQSNIRKANYDKESLEKLFVAYHKCVNAEILYDFTTEQKKNLYVKEKPGLDLGVVSGLSITKLKLTSTYFDGFKYSAHVDYPVSLKFTGGLFMNVVLAGNLCNWSIYNELLLSSFSVGHQYVENFSEEHFTIIDTKLEYSYLKLNSMIRYRFKINKDLNLFVNVGISNGYAIIEKNSYVNNTTFFGTKTVTDGLLFESKKSESGTLAGFGSGYKKYLIEARFEKGSGMSSDHYLDSKANRIYIILGYKF